MVMMEDIKHGKVKVQEAFAQYKVALVHDWLTGMRGGEKVLEVFCELFPQADLYTLLHIPGRTSATIENMKIHTSWMQKLPLASRYYRHYLPVMPFAIESFDLSGYDLILSSSHCVAKGIPYQGNTTHVSYVHAPMRYMWNMFDLYFDRKRVSPMVYWAARAVRPFLRRWDKRSSDAVHHFLCNSENIRRQISQIYHRQAEVIHPPVSLDQFFLCTEKSDYFLMVGAFAPNKQVGLAIEAFNRLGLPLKIAGTGQEENYCRSIAKPNIEFLGEVSDAELVRLFQQAKAFIFPGEDDFGITPLEAQSCGTPVVAYGRGGALETVTTETGVFFYEATPDALVDAVETIINGYSHFHPQKCASQAKRFGREIFKEKIATAVLNVLQPSPKS